MKIQIQFLKEIPCEYLCFANKTFRMYHNYFLCETELLKGHAARALAASCGHNCVLVLIGMQLKLLSLRWHESQFQCCVALHHDNCFNR